MKKINVPLDFKEALTAVQNSYKVNIEAFYATGISYTQEKR